MSELAVTHGENNGVAIISVNWKAGGITCDCLTSLLPLDDKDWYAVICENGSPDDSAMVIRTYLQSRFREVSRSITGELAAALDYFEDSATLPRITLVLSQKNLGLAGGSNLGYRCIYPGISPEYVWFLNNDTEVEPDCLTELRIKMESNPKIGICGSTLLYAHQRNCVQVLGGAQYWPIFGKVKEIGQGALWPVEDNEASAEAKMDYVSGAAMFVSAVFLRDVGLMSDEYFLYYEELDWAERARNAGYRLGYASRSIVYHKEGAVLGSGKSSKRSALAEYYGLRNRLVVTRKFFPLALPTVYLFCWLQVAKRILKGQFARARMMAGVLLGLRRSAP